MSEKPPEMKKFIDRQDPEGKYDLYQPLSPEDVIDALEHIKPALKDFFSKVVSEQPDYLILLDKGARSFGAPFVRYIHDLKLGKEPQVLFWNDDTYKRNFSSSAEAQEALKRDFIDAKPEADFQNKKIYIVDETIYAGKTARMLRDFFDKNNIDGHYFAFTDEKEYSDENEKSVEVPRGIENDERFTVYDIPAESRFFPQLTANLYIRDVQNPTSGIIETKRRFEHVDEDINESVSEHSRKKKVQADEARRMVEKLIYDALKELD